VDTNVIYCGDNLDVLPKYVPDASVDLVYIDPPFNTSRNYEVFWGEAQEKRAFEDRFGDVNHYMEWMWDRIRELYRVLKPTGSFYYHCDPHASHYIKTALDKLFGFDNFRNEIIWKRTTSHGDSRHGFSRVTDTVFYYAKSPRTKWNPQYQPHSASYIRSHYSHVDAQGRPYRLDNIIRSQSMGPRPNLVYEYKGFTPPHGWRVKQEKLQAIDQAGRLQWAKTGTPYLIRPLNPQGNLLDNLWTDIPPVNSQSQERRGYPTQKPLALLERIVAASSNPGDVVLDAFCGCGTTLEAAAKHKRQWVGIDFSPTACRVMAQRLEERLGLREGTDFQLRDMPKTLEQLHRMPYFEFENWGVVALGGIPNRVKVGDYGIDGRLYLADVEKGHRGDFMEALDVWYPIQVKQIERVGRPEIDKFETAMRRDRRTRGYVVAFGFSRDAIREIKRANNDGLDIRPVTVNDILRYEQEAGR